MGVLAELSAYLATQGCGTVGTSLFEGIFPDPPAAAPLTLGAALYERGGRRPAYTFGGTGGAAVEYPLVRVEVRCATYETGETRARAIQTALEAVVNTALSGTTYLRITPLTPPMQSGQDLHRRFIWAQTFECWRKP